MLPTRAAIRCGSGSLRRGERAALAISEVTEPQAGSGHFAGARGAAAIDAHDYCAGSIVVRVYPRPP